MSAKIQDGGQAFPNGPCPDFTDDSQHGERGMSLRDYFAAKESLTDHDSDNSVVSHELAEALGGPKPKEGWVKGNILEMTKWEARWRAGLRYLRADAMLAERAKREASQ